MAIAAFGSSASSTAVPIALAVFIAWRIYKRVRRLIGRQQLAPVRPWFTAILFPILLLVLAAASLAHPVNLACLAGGAVIGLVLGIYGNRLTRFEVTPQGLFYTPNAHLGIALSLLFIARVVYRIAQIYMIDPGALRDDPHVDMARSPVTLLIFATLAAYYASYAVGLLRWRHEVQKNVG